MERTREWIVGLDLTERSHGAMRFAAWLRGGSKHPPDLRGVHVASTPTVTDQHGDEELPDERMRLVMRVSAQSLGVEEAFGSFEWAPGDPPEEVLPRVAEAHDAIGLIVGRSAATEEWSLVSLGKVTRRLLRHVPRPIVVVPPDLDPTTFGHGPVLIAVAPVDHAVEAVRFGWQLAEALGLPALLVQVLSDPSTHALAAADPAYTYTTMALTDPKLLIARAERELLQWLDDHGLPRLPVRATLGRNAPTVLEVASAEQASLIVCGSRRLSLGERIFQSSLGSDLASHADRPVVVVPPLEDPVS